MIKQSQNNNEQNNKTNYHCHGSFGIAHGLKVSCEQSFCDTKIEEHPHVLQHSYTNFRTYTD